MNRRHALLLSLVASIALLAPAFAQDAPAPASDEVPSSGDGRARAVLFYWPG